MIDDLRLLVKITVWRLRDHHELTRRERRGLDIPRVESKFDPCPHVGGSISRGNAALLAMTESGVDGLRDLNAAERDACRFCTPRSWFDRLLARMDNGRALRMREEQLAALQSYLRARDDHPAGKERP